MKQPQGRDLQRDHESARIIIREIDPPKELLSRPRPRPLPGNGRLHQRLRDQTAERYRSALVIERSLHPEEPPRRLTLHQWQTEKAKVNATKVTRNRLPLRLVVFACVTWNRMILPQSMAVTTDSASVVSRNGLSEKIRAHFVKPALPRSNASTRKGRRG